MLADKGYCSKNNRDKLRDKTIIDGIMHKRARGKGLDDWQREMNKNISRYRSRIESKFGEMKKWHGLDRAIYYGIDRVKIFIIMTILAVNLKRIVKLSKVQGE